MELNQIKRVYFIGIGGIGMSAIARYFNEKKITVSGYDKTETPLTRQLATEGISIHYEENLSLIDKQADLVVYTPAVPATHSELVYYRQHGFEVAKRSDVLQAITQNLLTITVAGTHGKTTISSLIAHILRHCGYGCNAFLGGITVNYGVNFWSSDQPVAVVEADEYDRSFLKLNPAIAVLTAMDPDHLDIYGTEAEMQKAFIQYTKNIKPTGTLIVKFGLARDEELQATQKIRYSLQNNVADIFAQNIRLYRGGYIFDVLQKDWKLEDIHLPIGGMHNVENTVAAIAVTYQLGISNEQIKAAIKDFQGIKRRFEYIVKNERVVYIDDYAHHPEELKALILGAKSLFPDKQCTVIFQPHLYSRTRDLADGFAKSLELADEVLLLPIYPARELPIEGVSSELIRQKMKQTPVQITDKMAALEWVKHHPTGLLITAGAGDIDQLAEPIKNILNNA